MKMQMTILAILLSISVFSQIKPVNFNDCNPNKMFVLAETVPTWKCDSISMIDFMNRNVIDKELVKVNEGKVIIGILINEDGKTCCMSFINLSKFELNPLAFKDAINKMPNWTPGLQNSKPISFLKQQVLNLKNGKFVSN